MQINVSFRVKFFFKKYRGFSAASVIVSFISHTILGDDVTYLVIKLSACIGYSDWTFRVDFCFAT